MIYKKVITTLILFFISIILHAQNNDINKKIIGKWKCGKKTYEFKDNNELILDFGEFKNNGKVFQIKVNSRYSVISSNCLLTFMDNIKYPFIWVITIKENQMYIVNYKSIEDQIDEVCVFRKEGSKKKKIKISGKTHNFVIPDNYAGNIFVNYNCTNVLEKKVFSDTSVTLYISNNGLLKTQEREDPWGYVEGNIKFSQIRGEDKKEVPFFISGDFVNLTKQDIINKGYKLDSIYVHLLGYNQTGRNEINKIFNERIYGNVLMFRIGTLKDLLFNPFTNSNIYK